MVGPASTGCGVPHREGLACAGKSRQPAAAAADTTAENTLATAPRERLHPGVARYFREAGLK